MSAVLLLQLANGGMGLVERMISSAMVVGGGSPDACACKWTTLRVELRIGIIFLGYDYSYCTTRPAWKDPVDSFQFDTKYGTRKWVKRSMLSSDVSQHRNGGKRQLYIQRSFK